MRTGPADPSWRLRAEAELERPAGPDETIKAAELVKVPKVRVFGDVHPAGKAELEYGEERERQDGQPKVDIVRGRAWLKEQERLQQKDG